MKKKVPHVASLDFERPLVTVDLVIFSVEDDCLKVLLVRRPAEATEPFPQQLALPGGFVDVKRDASLEDCALRKLHEKTGVSTPYLEQLGSWGNGNRDPRGWSATHAYFALISKPSRKPDAKGSAEAQWIDVTDAKRKKLAFDHRNILQAAIDRLKSKVEYTSLPAFLLAEPFTLSQLQHTYEVVLERQVDRTAFRKRMLDASFLSEVGVVDGQVGRAPTTYKVAQPGRLISFPRTFRANE